MKETYGLCNLLKEKLNYQNHNNFNVHFNFLTTSFTIIIIIKLILTLIIL